MNENENFNGCGTKSVTVRPASRLDAGSVNLPMNASVPTSDEANAEQSSGASSLS
jgi:hypothetical protein